MQQQGQTTEATGTRDETYDVISIVYHALQGAENCEIYAEDAENEQLRNFFQQAGDQQRQLADQGKQLLIQCLQNEGGQSAFRFGQDQQDQARTESETVSTAASGQTGGGIG